MESTVENQRDVSAAPSEQRIRCWQRKRRWEKRRAEAAREREQAHSGKWLLAEYRSGKLLRRLPLLHEIEVALEQENVRSRIAVRYAAAVALACCRRRHPVLLIAHSAFALILRCSK